MDHVDQIIRDVAELPDRTSPLDWPEAMLVTADELRAILQGYFDWQPISTAPKDGTRVLLWLADKGCWATARCMRLPGQDWDAWWLIEWDVYDVGGPDGYRDLTYWAPLPAPPEGL